MQLAIVVSLAVVLGMPFARSAQSPTVAGPSFTCEPANNTIETTICRDAALAARDQTMATLFEASRKDAFGQGQSQQRSLQRQWLITRNEQCATGDIRACLSVEYDARLNELAVAALLQVPTAALAELAREDAKSAVLYEAIYRYATIDDVAERVNMVARLIAPAFDEFRDKPWASPLSDVADARVAASSDRNFSRFLDVASVSGYTLTMPCSALVRRPGLFAALDAAYGGAIDGQLIQSDCEAMTPKLEAVGRLTNAVVSVQPVCEGTIRFSLGRNFDKTLIAVRLHRTQLWKTKPLDFSQNAQEQNVDASKDVDGPHFAARHPVLIRQAVDELTEYYSSRFGVPSALAETQARGAIGAIIYKAYDLCELG